jgi:hypothetical protein
MPYSIRKIDLPAIARTIYFIPRVIAAYFLAAKKTLLLPVDTTIRLCFRKSSNWLSLILLISKMGFIRFSYAISTILVEIIQNLNIFNFICSLCCPCFGWNDECGIYLSIKGRN